MVHAHVAITKAVRQVAGLGAQTSCIHPHSELSMGPGRAARNQEPAGTISVVLAVMEKGGVPASSLQIGDT